MGPKYTKLVLSIPYTTPTATWLFLDEIIQEILARTKLSPLNINSSLMHVEGVSPINSKKVFFKMKFNYQIIHLTFSFLLTLLSFAPTTADKKCVEYPHSKFGLGLLTCKWLKNRPFQFTIKKLCSKTNGKKIEEA